MDSSTLHLCSFPTLTLSRCGVHLSCVHRPAFHLSTLYLYTLHFATLPLCTLHIGLRCSSRAAPPVPSLQRKRTNYSSGSADFFTFAAHALLPASSLRTTMKALLARSTRLATIAAQRPKSAVGEAAGLGRKGYGVLPCGRATAGAAPRGDGHLPFSATNVWCDLHWCAMVGIVYFRVDHSPEPHSLALRNNRLPDPGESSTPK